MDFVVINKYWFGFNECVSEVSKYLFNIDGLNVEFWVWFLNYLVNVIMNVELEENKDLLLKFFIMNRINYNVFYFIKINNLNVVYFNIGSFLKVKGNFV